VLQTCVGETLNIRELLEKGPIVVKFYRGSWCAFCSADLKFLQENYDVLHESGATVIAISTQLQEKSAEVVREMGLKFHVVADTDTEVAKKFGLLFHLTEEIAQAYDDAYGVNLLKFYPQKDPLLTVPATYVIDKTGTVVYAFMDEDFRKRADMSEVVYFVKKSNRLDRQRYFLRCHQEEGCVIAGFVKGVLAKRRASQRKRNSRDAPSQQHRGSVSSDSSTSTGMSASSSEYEREPLKYCLQNDDFLESFKWYLKRTYCTENLLFFMEATDYAEGFETRSEEENRAQATKIFTTFVQVGADLEVNIDDTTREAIAAQFSAGEKAEITPELFEHATKEIYILMETDSFSKWKRTKEYEYVWEKNGSIEFLIPINIAAVAA